MPRPLLAFAITALLACAAQAAEAKVLITIDKSTQEMTVEVDGVPRWQWPVSTGARGYATPSGTFKAFRMEAEHFSKEFDDAPMPHSIFFTQRGHAIHGYYDTRRLGRPVSHGCVRLNPANATKLYALVEQQGVTNTTVVITGGEPAAVARPAPRQVEPSYEPDPRLYRRAPQQPGYQGYPGYSQPAPGYYGQDYYDPYRRGGYGGYYERW